MKWTDFLFLLCLPAGHWVISWKARKRIETDKRINEGVGGFDFSHLLDAGGFQHRESGWRVEQLLFLSGSKCLCVFGSSSGDLPWWCRVTDLFRALKLFDVMCKSLGGMVAGGVHWCCWHCPSGCFHANGSSAPGHFGVPERLLGAVSTRTIYVSFVEGSNKKEFL